MTENSGRGNHLEREKKSDNDQKLRAKHFSLLLFNDPGSVVLETSKINE